MASTYALDYPTIENQFNHTMCSEYLEELYIRAVYKVLVEVGHDLVLSAPLKNQSTKVTSVDVRQDDAYVLTT